MYGGVDFLDGPFGFIGIFRREEQEYIALLDSFDDDGLELLAAMDAVVGHPAWDTSFFEVLLYLPNLQLVLSAIADKNLF
jgi:hypothetical protein